MGTAISCIECSQVAGLIQKLAQMAALMDSILQLGFQIKTECFPKSRHCFADSCELKQTTVTVCSNIKLGLYARPIVHMYITRKATVYFRR